MTQLHTPMPARSRNIISAGSCGTTRGGRGDGPRGDGPRGGGDRNGIATVMVVVVMVVVVLVTCEPANSEVLFLYFELLCTAYVKRTEEVFKPDVHS